MVTEAGSYLRLIDSCITQLKAQGPSRTCNESYQEEEGVSDFTGPAPLFGSRVLRLELIGVGGLFTGVTVQKFGLGMRFYCFQF